MSSSRADPVLGSNILSYCPHAFPLNAIQPECESQSVAGFLSHTKPGAVLHQVLSARLGPQLSETHAQVESRIVERGDRCFNV